MTPIVYEFSELPQGPTRNGSHRDYRVVNAITRKVKEAAVEVIEAQRGDRPPAMFPHVHLAYHFYLPTKGRRDWTNLVTAAKPYEDALTPRTDKDGNYFQATSSTTVST